MAEVNRTETFNPREEIMRLGSCTCSEVHMCLEHIIQFARKNAVVVPPNTFETGCIDSREDVVGLRIPGDRFGLFGALIALLQLLKRTHGSIGIEFHHLIEVFERQFGGMFCHSDIHAINSGKNNIVAGCGYGNGLIEKAVEYGVDDFSHHLNDYLVDFEARGGRPKILEGENLPQAVLAIAKPAKGQRTIALPGTGKCGRKVLVFHFENWLEMLESAASEVLKDMANGVHVANIREHIKVVALRQLKVTLKHFPRPLPLYYVFSDNNGIVHVKFITGDAATAFA